MNRVLAVLVCAVFIICMLGCGRAKVNTEVGTLEGSRIKIAVPPNWNKKVLIGAHGYRPDNAPLAADFFESATLKAHLLH